MRSMLWSGNPTVLAALAHFVAAGFASSAIAQSIAATYSAATTEADSADAAATEPAPLYAVSTRIDRSGRILAPVWVNQQGPFRFILDTGANRSAISEGLARRLGLAATGEVAIAVHGVTGTGILPSVRVEQLQAGQIEVGRDRKIPVLSPAVLGGADGILGIEGLEAARIDVDFENDRVEIRRSTGRELRERGFIRIPAFVRHRGLLMVPARVGRTRVQAIIDTGAERTLGNLALRDALFQQQRSGAEVAIRTVIGATPELGTGIALRVPTIELGKADLNDLDVTFGTLHVFRIWDLEREPAMLIGMDLLGIVRKLVIDYRRREISILPVESPR